MRGGPGMKILASLGAGRSLLVGAIALACNGAFAQAAVQEMPMSAQMRFDPARFEDGERIGLLSTALLFEPTPGWWMGPAVVGAARGERGGFFVLGGQIERRWRVAGPWAAQVGLMAGGGGGGGAPVGGGLMVVPSASFLYDWGPVQTGLSWSRVNMPSGQLGSSQIGLVLQWDGRFRYFDARDAGRSSADAGRTGFGIDRMMLGGAQLHVRARPGQPASSLRLVGVRAERRAGEHGYWGVETAAATHGGADGYMELLGSAGWETSAVAVGLPDLYLGVRGALGMGGGGSVDTGGGALGKAAGVLRWELGRHAFVGVEAGAVRAASGDYRARYAQWQLGWQFDHPGQSGPVDVAGVSWSGGVQHVVGAARKDGRKLSLDTVGIKLRHKVGEQFYLTGQAHSAFAGQAGAYSLGLAGIGWETRLGEASAEQGAPGAWSLAAELLAGAAGGGGVATQGGAVAQGMLYLGHAAGRSSDIQLGLGRIRSQHGGLNSAVVDISWTQHFGIGQR